MNIYIRMIKSIRFIRIIYIRMRDDVKRVIKSIRFIYLDKRC